MVKKALGGLVGVRQAEVSWATKQAEVAYDAEQVTVAQMVAAIKQAGFSARRHQ